MNLLNGGFKRWIGPSISRVRLRDLSESNFLPIDDIMFYGSDGSILKMQTFHFPTTPSVIFPPLKYQLLTKKLMNIGSSSSFELLIVYMQ